MPSLNGYLHKLSHLKRGVTKYGLAPHKTVLHITLLALSETAILPKTRLMLILILQARFRSIGDYWFTLFINLISSSHLLLLQR
jgi:putative restriction endonuclease